jgi:hypothetical protein
VITTETEYSLDDESRRLVCRWVFLADLPIIFSQSSPEICSYVGWPICCLDIRDKLCVRYLFLARHDPGRREREGVREMTDEGREGQPLDTRIWGGCWEE